MPLGRLGPGCYSPSVPFPVPGGHPCLALPALKRSHIMQNHTYLRAYMADVTAPTVLVVFMLACFAVLRFGHNMFIPIERFPVFPLAIVPRLWGAWNMLYIAMRKHWHIPLDVHRAHVVPLVAGPLTLGNAFLGGLNIAHFALAMFTGRHYGRNARVLSRVEISGWLLQPCDGDWLMLNGARETSSTSEAKGPSK